MTTETRTSWTAAAFGARDVDYLVAHLTIPQLRREIRKAEAQRSVAQHFRGTPFTTGDDTWPWSDYVVACRMAIDILWWRQPKAASSRGPRHIDVAHLKAASDISGVIAHYTEVRRSGRVLKACCPIHQERSPSLTVYTDDQRWWCYGCNQGGDVIAFVMAVEGCDFRAAAAKLGGA